MHDSTGKELKAGDYILIPYRITETQATPDYCNVTAKSVIGRKPDGLYETFVGNAVVTIRCNVEDLAISVVVSEALRKVGQTVAEATAKEAALNAVVDNLTPEAANAPTPQQ